MIKATTVFNEPALSLLAKISVRKFKLQCCALSVALLIVGTLFNLLVLRSLWYNLLMLTLCLIYLLRPHFYYKKLLKRYTTREREVYPSPRIVETSFENNQISSHTINNDSTVILKYDALTTVYETKDYLVLMTEGKQGLPIAKAQIEDGSHDELISLLKSKVPQLKHKKLK